MSPIYVPGKVVLRKTWQPMDADAAAYITAVETADGQALEEKVKIAIDNFVLGCKADGIWNAIKASCILAGARTLAGALVPLVGTAPSNTGFDAADYNRKTGLKGGTGKRLNSNRLATADPDNDAHYAVYIGADAGSGIKIGATDNVNFLNRITNNFRIRTSVSVTVPGFPANGFAGATTNGTITARGAGVSVTGSSASAAAPAVNYFVFTTDASTASGTDRLSFYSIGSNVNLALLDARVTDLINAFGVAIP